VPRWLEHFRFHAIDQLVDAEVGLAARLKARNALI
jgi:hypothetical protein